MTRSNVKEFCLLDSLVLQLVAWAQERPRTYAEAIEAWGTYCPGLAVWEEALGDRLIEVDHAPVAGFGGAVRATARGRAALRRGVRPARAAA